MPIRGDAEKGVAAAQYELAAVYALGIGGAGQNAQTAHDWAAKAAAQGHAGAQYFLGICHEEGRNAPRSSAKAKEWYQKAADQGHAAAQNNLAVRFVVGKGVPKDFISAYAWYSVAARNGFKGAAQKRDGLGRVIPRDQMNKARAMARDLINRIEAKKRSKK